MIKTYKNILILIFFLSLTSYSFSQNYKKIIKSLSFEDKVWVMKNYSSVKKAQKISQNVINVMDSLNKEKFLGGNSEGGRFDAFRHVFWMYSLSKELGKEKARRIGKIYEKYNEYVFKTQTMSGYDKAGEDMDLFNNEVGINLSKENIVDSLVFSRIEELILNGEAKIIKKNDKKESLDKNNNIIEDSVWKKSWQNDRVLINSNNK
jgi:hypothetical protein